MSMEQENFDSRIMAELKKARKKIIQLESQLASYKQAKDDLIEREERFRQIYDHMSVGVVWFSLGFYIEGANKAYCRMLGYQELELIGRHLKDITHPESVVENLNQHSQLIAGQIDHYSMEKKYVHKNGNIVHGLLNANLVRNSEGKPHYCLGSVLDITDRKQVEEKLKHSEALLKRTEGLTRVGGWEYMVREGKMTWTDEVYRIHGLTREEYDPNQVQQNIEFYMPGDRETIEQAFRNAVNKGIPYDLELGFVSAKGEHLWVRTIGSPVLENGQVIKVVGNIMDITERKRAEEALKESEEKYKKLFNTTLDAIALIDEDGRFLTVNPSMAKSFKMTQEELEGKYLHQVMPEHVVKRRLGKGREAIEKNQVISFEDKRDGRHFQNHLVPVSTSLDKRCFQVIARDITKRKEMEERLQILKYAVESSINGFFLIDLNGHITYINPSFLRIGKFEQESEVLGKHFAEFLEKQDKADQILTSLGNQEEWNGELKVRRKDNVLIYIMLFTSVVKDKDNHPICFMGSFIDITSRKKAEEKLQQAYEHLEYRVEARTKELKKSESRLKRSQKVAKVATWERDLQTGEMFWSDEQYRLFCYEPGQLPEKEITKNHIYPKDQNRIKKHLNKAIEEDKDFNIQFFYTTKNGEKRIGHCLGRVEKDDSGKPLHIYGTMQDVTEKIEMEQALNESKQSYEQLLLSTQQVSSYKKIIGKSERMQQIYTLIQQLANVDTTVLITGESGTGKELIVEALHYSGARAKGPLIKVNCSALSEHLLESELFGHVKGAFTGATFRKIGRIESAEGGTLFLDEIGDISPNLQLKLLRFLQEKNFERVGDVHTLSADVRIIAATNADLFRKVNEGSFREDLYYRLKVIPINLPPLRERPEDIPLLVNHFCQRFAQTFNKEISGVSDQVMRFFIKHSWPGNVRELEHILECACLFCPGGEIRLEHLPENEIRQDADIVSSLIRKKKVGKEDLIDALNRAKGNKTKAAELLGVSRRTIYRKLFEHNLISK